VSGESATLDAKNFPGRRNASFKYFAGIRVPGESLILLGEGVFSKLGLTFDSGRKSGGDWRYFGFN
jgi:hypothetical protein